MFATEGPSIDCSPKDFPSAAPRHLYFNKKHSVSLSFWLWDQRLQKPQKQQPAETGWMFQDSPYGDLKRPTTPFLSVLSLVSGMAIMLLSLYQKVSTIRSSYGWQILNCFMTTPFQNQVTTYTVTAENPLNWHSWILFRQHKCDLYDLLSDICLAHLGWTERQRRGILTWKIPWHQHCCEYGTLPREKEN